MKVKYGLKNVHYSLVTETVDGTTGAVTTSYGTVKAWAGAVNISLDPEDSSNPFYADNGVYYEPNANNGYSGDFESALVPEDVSLSVLGQSKDDNGVITETNEDQTRYIALMFEFEGDASGRRYLLYRCHLTRPSIASQTKAESVDVQTETVSITASARPDDGKISARVDKDGDAYADWYTSVYVFADDEEEPSTE